MKIIRNIVASDIQPENKNNIWLDTKTNTLNWGGEVIKAAPYNQTIEVTEQEIMGPAKLISDKLNEAGITCELGDTVDITVLKMFCTNTAFHNKVTAVKLTGVAETADDFYFSTEKLGSWAIAFPALNLVLQSTSNSMFLGLSRLDTYESIEQYLYKDLNSLNAFLSKYDLDKWNVAGLSFDSSAVNNKGIQITVKDKMPVIYCGKGMWITVPK